MANPEALGTYLGYHRFKNRRTYQINEVTCILCIHSHLRSFADIINLVFLKTIKSSSLKLFQGYESKQ